uniref:beta strand repeat-containing protein n=1 Tax=Croceivirga lutea TaxID=1775167 RepID=UPI00163B3534
MKNLYFKNSFWVVLMLYLFVFVSFSYAQEVPFGPRLTQNGNSYINIRGDYTFLSNSVMNRVDWVYDATNWNEPYNGNQGNNNWHREYVDIDNDPTTFSSSSSSLSLPECSEIYYAGLYWAGNYDYERRSNYVYQSEPFDDLTHNDVTEIKFRVPGGSYVDLVADNNPDPVGEEDAVIIDGFASGVADSPYVCYKNVTNQLQALADPSGEYFVANVRGTRGYTSNGVAGWTLVIIYENPTLPGKYISVFDGYEGVTTATTADRTEDIVVSGFNTIPTGSVNAKIGVSVLEGETDLTGDSFSIMSNSSGTFNPISNAANPANNFFNSSITIDGAHTTNRNLDSRNTLGYDSDIFELDNPGNSYIGNNDTSATLRLSTSSDWFGAFLVTFGIEIIEPDILLSKTVEDIAGNDITGSGVNLGQELDYILSFRNRGNDNATNYSIRDVLPTNVTLNELSLQLPPGVTYNYDPVANEIIFNIPDNLVEINDPFYEIRMRVRVAQNCYDFVNACQNVIENTAFSTYQGVDNPNEITDDPSVSNFDNCFFTTPGATNFLLDDLSACSFSRQVQLCGEDVTLDAGDNFDAYTWYSDENGDGQLDAGDVVITDGDPDNDPSTFVVTQPGFYLVDKDVAQPCLGFQEAIEVVLFGNTQVNPIATLINDTSNTVEGEVVVCPNDGEELPQIFLCGLNDTELIQINIPDADSIEWEQLDEASCGAATQDCANTNATCTWNNIATGNDFIAQDSGQYRLVINYQNGCFSRFYFNIYKNPLDPQFNSSDIICNTPGNITVTNMPLDYEFQLINSSTGTVVTPYNTDPSFTINTNGVYTVEMRQQGVAGGCIFRIEDIGIRERNFQVDVTTTDTNCNGLGAISISALDVEPQYYYEILQGGTSIDTHGPTIDNNYTFNNLNDGTYEIRVSTDDGCSFSNTYTIVDRTDLDLSALVTKSVDCTDGIVELTATGGFPNPDYFYAIWSHDGVDLYPDFASIPGSAYQSSSTFTFDATEVGNYEFVVVDDNLCHFVSNEITISEQSAFEYTTSLTNETCFDQEDGTFTVNVTNSNGYSLSYLLTFPDSSTATNTSGVFTGLGRGGYVLSITQSQGGISCDFVETFSIGGPTTPLTIDAVLLQDDTCLQDGIIEAQNAAGGTPPYEYSIDGINFDGSFGAEQFGGLTAGNYQITVRDANGCTAQSSTIAIDAFVAPSDLIFTASAPVCPSNISNVSVDVVNGEGPYTFEIVTPAVIAATTTTGNTATFDALVPDSYLFRVTDANGCFYEESLTIAPVTPLSVVGNLISNVTCFDDTDGEVSFTVSDFSTAYNYSVSGPQSFSGNNEANATISFANLDDGTYTITVTDVDTNCTDTASVTVNRPTAQLTLTASETQPTCSASGSVVLSATGGWGSNTFTLTNPDTTPFGSNGSGTFSNLSQTGTYTASVTDANGCTVTTTFDINPAVAPTLEIIPNDSCFDSAAGLTLTANVISGGDGNFEYSFNGGAFQTNNVFNSLAAGTYTIAVRDGNNCSDTATITINPELGVTATASNITACGTDTSIDITGTGGDGNLVYAVVADGATPTTGDFAAASTVTVNASGDYDVYVRDNNGASNFCEASFDISIAQDAPLAMSISDSQILCSGDNNGAITITASGGEAPYTYSNNGGGSFQTSNVFNNLGAGNFNLVVRDANGCTVSEIRSLTEPQTLSASAAVTELAECNPGVGAEVRITNALGGTAPYEYSFDGGSSYGSNSIEYLLPGNHTLAIRDANNCTFFMNITVEPEPVEPVYSTSISYDCDGEGVVTVNTPDTNFDYTYELNGVLNTPNTSNVFNDVPVGNHNITINYISNVAPAVSTLLTESFGQGANTSITEIDPAYCYEPQDGTPSTCGFGTDTHIQDGEYSVTQVITNPYGSWRSPNDHTGDANGRFLAINVGGVAGVGGVVYRKDAIEVIPNRDITISLFAFNLQRTGTSGGDPSVEIQLVDSSGNVIANTTTGNIPKNNNANDWQNYSVNLNPGANSNLDIVIRTNSAVVGGNDIAIDDIQAFQIPELCAQSVVVPVSVEAGNEFTASITDFNFVTCNAGNDGSIEIEVENFDTVNGYQYAVNGGAFSAAQTTSTFTINTLVANTYSIEIRDVLNNSCTVTLNQVISEPDPIVTSAAITDQLTCTNGGGTITASVNGRSTSFDFQLEDGIGNPIAGFDFATNGNNTVFTGLAAGDYIVVARDPNGCTDATDAVLTITIPNPLTFTTTATTCYSGANDATIQVNVTSGNGGYTFSLNGGPFVAPTPANANTHTFTNLAAGNYTIDVRDDNGCTAPTQNITINPELGVTATASNITACGTDTTIDITGTGGDGNLVYAVVTDGVTPTAGDFAAASTATVNAAGDYDVYVRDNNGGASFCEASFDISIVQDTPLAVTPTITNVTCFGNNDGGISIVASGGEAPYMYSNDNGGTFQTSPEFSNLVAGNYDIAIRDVNGCTSTATVTLNQPNQLVAEAALTQNYTCTQDGEITVGSVTATTGGSGSYQYSIDGGTSWSTATAGGITFGGLTNGNYAINVRDAAQTNCIITLAPITINPLPIAPTLTFTVAYNCDGTGNISVLPNDPSYTYAINGGAFQVANTFNNIAVGTHSVVVDYGSNCTTSANVTVEAGNEFTASITDFNFVTCNAGNDGSIEIEVENFDTVNGYQYAVNGGAFSAAQTTSTFTINTLVANTYSIEIRDVLNNSCTVTLNQVISEPDPIVTSAAITDQLTCTNGGGTITASVNGRSTSFDFQLEDGIGNPIAGFDFATNGNNTVFTGLAAGDYIVVARDPNGCTDATDAVLTITIPNPLTFTTTATTCYSGANDATIQVNVTSGNGGYTFSLNGGPFVAPTPANANTHTFTNLAAGNYTIDVRDDNGCTAPTQNITINPEL